MNAFIIQQHLGKHPWGQLLTVYEQVSSTNTLLKALAQQGAPNGTVIIADRQSAGRGRLGRSFLSPGEKGVYMSVLLRPQVFPEQIMHLTCAAAVAVCDAVEAAAGVRPNIKWVNDLILEKRKLGGILTELSLDPQTQKVDFAIVGVGINCMQTASDFDESIRDMATSLLIASGKTIDRSRLAAQMIRSFHRMSSALLNEKEHIMKKYALDCITIGQQIQVIQGDTVRSGRAIGIDVDGGLIVTDHDGITQTVSSGEVSVRGMYGYV